MTIQPMHSAVLLRPVGDIGDTAFGGDGVHDFHSPHNSWSVEAEVIAISKSFSFMGKEMDEMREEWGDDVRSEAEMCSLHGDVPIEVSVGDTVIFDWRRMLEDAEKAYKVAPGQLIVAYSDLIARVDPGGLYPLNGLVFAVPADTDSLIAAKEDRGGLWDVIAEGCRVRRWLDEIFPEVGWPPLVGKSVFCDYRSAVAVESPLFSKYDHGGKRFHMFARHHIHALLT